LRGAPDLVSQGARLMYGVYTRDDGYMARLLSGVGQVPGNDRDERRANGSGAKGRDQER
jgi:hypothetical protein